MPKPDLTIVYYTANYAPIKFSQKIRKNLWKQKGSFPLISVSQKPLNFGKNIVVKLKRSYLNIYRQILIGAKASKSKYIALAEDDILYSPDHFFIHRPKDAPFAYNMNVWSLYTWTEAMFSYKDRRVMHSLICERDALIETFEERFKKHPIDEEVELAKWSEPGKYEKQLGVKRVETERFFSKTPNIAFSHKHALSFNHLGLRKRMGYIKNYSLPYWGSADDIKNKYVQHS